MVEIKEPIGIGGFGVNCCIVQKDCTFKQSCKQQKCPKTSLPWEIIVDILFRLPVEDLLRYVQVRCQVVVLSDRRSWFRQAPSWSLKGSQLQPPRTTTSSGLTSTFSATPPWNSTTHSTTAARFKFWVLVTACLLSWAHATTSRHQKTQEALSFACWCLLWDLYWKFRLLRIWARPH